MELSRVTKMNLDISSEVEVLNYQYTGVDPIEVISRVDLGDATNPIEGGAQYSLFFYIDDVLVTPASVIDVPIGRDKAIMVARPIALEPNDVVSVRVTGTVNDTSVNTVSTLRSSTPILRSDILGAGQVLVDHDYPTTDNLRVVTPDGVGIEDSNVKAYLTTEYDAGMRGTNAIRGQTLTDTTGRWIAPFALDPGSYTFVFSSPGYAPAVRVIGVS